MDNITFLLLTITLTISMFVRMHVYEGVLISPQPDQEGNKLQRPNSGFIQHTPHEAQYTSQSVALTFASHSKKFRMLSVKSGLSGNNDLSATRKMANFQLFFSAQETGGSPTGIDPENRVGDQDTGSPGRPVSSGLQVLGEPGHCRARTRSLW